MSDTEHSSAFQPFSGVIAAAPLASRSHYEDHDDSSLLSPTITGTPSTSPPSKSSLSTWWKQFRPRLQREDYYEDSLNFSQSSFSPHQQQQHHPSRPSLPHMSHSSSAITTRQTTTHQEKMLENQDIFGVALEKSIKYANVSISLSDPATGEQFVYGYVPIVVAKCGVYLKKNATTVEGIFRLSGSARRIKDLQAIFNSPPRYGKGLDWTGFNVHDAANVLRRYLNNLPEPIIPLQFYESFREPLREFPDVLALLIESQKKAAVPEPSGSGPESQKSADSDESLSPSPLRPQSASSPPSPSSQQQQQQPSSEEQLPAQSVDMDEKVLQNTEKVIDRYQILIAQLPGLNRQLLMYILDLLSIFAAKSDENRMPASNLAAIFQPSLLSHPSHDMIPEEYDLSRASIEFLILHSNKFLSHIEEIAIKEHQAKKQQQQQRQVSGGSSNSDCSATARPLATKPANSNKLVETQTNLPNPIRRRHSKSLSSATPPVVLSKNGTIVNRDRPPPALPVIRKPIPTEQVTTPPNASTSSLGSGSDYFGSPPPSSHDGNQDGLLSSLRRSVSFSRRNSVKSKSRAGSGSSSSSTLSRSGTMPSKTRSRGWRGGSTSPRLPENSEEGHLLLPVTHQSPPRPPSSSSHSRGAARHHYPESPGSDTSESRGHVPGLGFFKSRSKSPHRDNPYGSSSQHHTGSMSSINIHSNPSIDQALATSPQKLPLPFSTASHNGSNSSLSAIDKTLSGNSAAGTTGGAESDDDTRRVSKWRRSLMLFNIGSNEDVSTSPSNQDLIPPPTLSGDESNLSPLSSGGGSGTSPREKVGGWFRKMKSKEKNLNGSSA
ncbi:hypothetical protein TRVA0_016S02630 [Trichomonascus vanleenenianus]|uniref:Rho GTPase-activating protein n=1 Tax=Trichomonascus vanleenenianus TaxID=2268995 RepID=UPI003ECB0EBD